MSITIYSYQKCSTCRKALNFLNKQEIAYQLKDITESPPSANELNKMLSSYEGKIKKLFNTSGNAYKEMGLSKKFDKMPIKKCIELLADHGMLIKRPFLIGGDRGIVGFNEAEWSIFFGLSR